MHFLFASEGFCGVGKDAPKHSIDIHILNYSMLLALRTKSSRLLQKRQNTGGKKTLGRRRTIVSAFICLDEESEPPRVRPQKMFALDPGVFRPLFLNETRLFTNGNLICLEN